MPRTSTLRPIPASETTELFCAPQLQMQPQQKKQAEQHRLGKKKSSKPRRRRRNAIKSATNNHNPPVVVTKSRSSSSDDESHNHYMFRKHQQQRFRPIAPPMPPPDPSELFLDTEREWPLDNAPQVLLWKSTSWTSSHSSSNNNNIHWDDDSPRSKDGNQWQDGDDDEEEHRTSPPNIFRTQGVQRQGPSPPTEDQADLTVGPQGPKWYDLDYWRQKLSLKCCLPPSEPSFSRKKDSSRLCYQKKRQLDYRPAYDFHAPHHGLNLPYHSVALAVPMHQLSPMTESSLPFGYRPNYPYHQRPQQKPKQRSKRKQPNGQSNHNVPPSSAQQQQRKQQNFITPSVTNDNRKQLVYPDVNTTYTQNDIHNDNTQPSKPARGHARSYSSLSGNITPPPPQHVHHGTAEEHDYSPTRESPVPDYQSVSSLEPGSPWRTPQQEPRVNVPPDTQPTMVTQSPVGNNSNVMSNRVIGLRRRANTGDSPRVPLSSSKPPVAPRRRTQSASGQKASPRLPSPTNNNNNNGNRPRDLDRSFSEASTTGSRHRRGGTVTEFSFESITNGPQFQNNVPKPSGAARSISLPLEVQVHHRPPRPKNGSTSAQPQQWTGEYYNSDAAVSPRHVLSPQSSMEVDEPLGETPDGYVSPLEEEVRHDLLHYNNHNGSNSPSCTITTDRRSPTEDTVDFVTGSPQSSDQSNPQDSLRQEKENVPEDDDQGEDSTGDSPFGKLKEPPAIPAGDSWMWKWVNNNHGLPAVQEDEQAATPTSAAVNDPPQTITIDDDDGGSVVVKRDKSPRQKQSQEYLPKNTTLEQQWQSQHGSDWGAGTALSGWVAFGLGDSLIQKLRIHNETLVREDIAYLMAPNETQTLWVTQSDGSFASVNLKRCRCEVREVSRQHGRAVVVSSNDSNEVVCTMLPVGLPSQYGGTSDEFAVAQPFPKGDYLPDDQQYTTMHVMFSLDALVKANGSWG